MPKIVNFTPSTIYALNRYDHVVTYPSHGHLKLGEYLNNPYSGHVLLDGMRIQPMSEPLFNHPRMEVLLQYLVKGDAIIVSSEFGRYVRTADLDGCLLKDLLIVGAEPTDDGRYAYDDQGDQHPVCELKWYTGEAEVFTFVE